MSGNKQFKEWLEAQYIAWRSAQTAKRVSLARFAEYLEISPGALNMYLLRGSVPTGANLIRLADKLGPEIYDVLDVPRPDGDLVRVIRAWGNLSDEAIKKIIQIIEG